MPPVTIMTSTVSLAEAWRNLRFLQLTIYLVLCLVLQALVYESVVGSLTIGLLYLNTLLVAFSAIHSRWPVRYGLMTLWLLLVIAPVLLTNGFNKPALLVSRLTTAGLILFSIVSVLRYIASKRTVTMDPLFAAIVAYLLIALFFAQLYSAANLIIPHAFTFPAVEDTSNNRFSELTFQYFSFITISTVGYGDIVPDHPLIRVLAALEAIIGQFYVAIVIAWLVSLYASQSPQKPD